MNFSRSCLLLLILAGSAAQPALAVTYDDGQVHDITEPLLGGAGGATVKDSATGDTTTVNARSGAVINGVQAYDSSNVNVYDGSQITADLNALNQSEVSIFGGSLINADSDNSSRLNISGGTFTGSGGRAVGAFGNAVINITGGDFQGATTYTVLSTDSSMVTVSGGSIDGEIYAQGDSTIDIWGGIGISHVTATSDSLMRIFGKDFAINSASISLATPFVISDDTYNGDLLTGTLADGSAISAQLFNGVIGSQIVLQAVPIPAALPLFGSAILGLAAMARRRLR